MLQKLYILSSLFLYHFNYTMYVREIYNNYITLVDKKNQVVQTSLHHPPNKKKDGKKKNEGDQLWLQFPHGHLLLCVALERESRLSSL